MFFKPLNLWKFPTGGTGNKCILQKCLCFHFSKQLNWLDPNYQLSFSHEADISSNLSSIFLLSSAKLFMHSCFNDQSAVWVKSTAEFRLSSLQDSLTTFWEKRLKAWHHLSFMPKTWESSFSGALLHLVHFQNLHLSLSISTFTSKAPASLTRMTAVRVDLFSKHSRHTAWTPPYFKGPTKTF